MSIIIIWLITSTLLAVGLVGAFIPVIPGPAIIFAAGFLHAFMTGFEQIGWTTVITLGITAALLMLCDYLAGIYGARKLGGTRPGIIGSVIGSIAGLIVFNIIGMLIGCFAGAVLGETLGSGKDVRGSFKVGFGSVLGLLASVVIRTVVTIAMITGFLIAAI